MKVPDECCRFVIKWDIRYLEDPELMRLGPSLDRFNAKSLRKVFATRAEVERARVEAIAHVEKMQACTPHAKVVRLVPSLSKRLALAAEMLVGVSETLLEMRNAGMLTDEVREKASEAYIELREVIREKNARRV